MAVIGDPVSRTQLQRILVVDVFAARYFNIQFLYCSQGAHCVENTYN